MEFMEFIESIKEKQVYIQTHNFPDPDALGSAYGLSKFLEHFGISSILCYDGKIDKLSTRKILDVFHIDIRSSEQLTDMVEESPIILVDSQKQAGNITDFIGDEVAVIDHHPTFVPISYQYKDIRMTGSCCTIVSEYFQKYNIEPDTSVATALLYGLKMDTNHFTRSVTELDIRMYTFLYPYADDSILRELYSNTLEFSDLSAFSAVFQTIRVFDSIGIAYIPFSCPDALIAMTSDFILSLEGVQFVVVYSKRELEWKFSVRSEDDKLDAGRIVYQALSNIGSGGGHASMAGGLVPIEVIREMGPHADHKICDLFLETAKKYGDKP